MSQWGTLLFDSSKKVLSEYVLVCKKNECDCCESDLGGAGCILYSDSPILCVEIINAMTLCVPPRDPGGFG